METQEIRAMTPDDLVQRLDDAHEELFNLRFQFSTGQLENFNRLTEVKRDIARLKTIMRERELEQMWEEEEA
ncbi:MAG: 50S ribosomal protein L29 [Anaerolineales bacterium]|nr:MAG: 50S ribosomal protein L29 [Anaerolineales bacterium]